MDNNTKDIHIKDNYEKFVNYLNFIFNKYADIIDWDHLSDDDAPEDSVDSRYNKDSQQPHKAIGNHMTSL